MQQVGILSTVVNVTQSVCVLSILSSDLTMTCHSISFVVNVFAGISYVFVSPVIDISVYVVVPLVRYFNFADACFIVPTTFSLSYSNAHLNVFATFLSRNFEGKRLDENGITSSNVSNLYGLFTPV